MSKVIGVRTTSPQMRITSRAAKVNIQNKPADLKIESPPAKVSVQSSRGQLQIDSTQARESMGYHTISAMADNIVGYANRQYDRGVADAVSDGDRMANSPQSNVIAQLAFESMFMDYNDRQFVLAFIPKVPPSVRFTPGNTQVDFTQNRPRVQVRPNRPMINVEPGTRSFEVSPGSIRIYLREPSTLDLTV